MVKKMVKRWTQGPGVRRKSTRKKNRGRSDIVKEVKRNRKYWNVKTPPDQSIQHHRELNPKRVTKEY